MRRSDILMLGIVLAMLVTVAGSIIAAGWMPGLEVILWAVALSVAAGTALAYSNFPSWTAHLTSLVYGAFVTIVIGITSQPDIMRLTDWREKTLLLIDKVIAFLQEAASNGTSRENVIFVLILSGLFWLLGYSAAWYSIRTRRIWHVILPAGATLFSNVYFYTGTATMVPFLMGYLVCAVTLLVLSHLAEREAGWMAARIKFTRTARTWSVAAGVAIALLASLVGWRVSEATTSAAGRDLLSQLNQPYNELLARWNRLFANLNNNVERNVDSYAQSVTLSGPRNLGQEPVMDVSAPPARHYWRATSYDNYDGLTWRNTIQTVTNAQANDMSLPLTGYVGRVPVQADFTLYRGSDSVYAPSLPLRANISSQATFEMAGDNRVDLTQLKLPVPLLPGNRYSALGSMSVANMSELRNAKGEFPTWVRERYLQVPAAVPNRVKRLAEYITADAATPFDKAFAIEQWLRNNIVYDEKLEAPPAGVEASEYILFDVKRAYCNYYATAMVTMLRSLEVPARVAVGYAQGEPAIDFNAPDKAVYHVKASDSHMWVEVFFPEWGWVEFEPTAGQPPIDRFAPETIATPTPAATFAPPTATPAPNATQEAAMTPTLEPAMPQPQDQQANPPSNSNLLADAWQWFINSPLPWLMALLAIVGVVLLALRYVETAGLSKLPGIERAYALVTRYAGWLGVNKRHHTPYEQANELSQRAPNAQAPVQQITDLYVQKRFAAPKDAPADASAEDAWQQARRWLRRALLRRR
jgi:transglutaminase-like putative cysteine protease